MPLPLQIICIILCAIALLILLTLSINGTLTIEYRDELSLYFSIFFIKIKLYPIKKHKKKKKHLHSMSRWRARLIRKRVEKREARREEWKNKFKIKIRKKDKTQKKEAPKKRTVKKESPSLPLPGIQEARDIIDVLGLAVELAAVIVKRFGRRLKIKAARINAVISSPDAATTAITYGAVTQTVNILLPILSEVKNFDIPRRKHFNISTDFTKDTPTLDLKISFSLRVWHLLDIPMSGVFYAIPRLPKFFDKVDFYRKKYFNRPQENEDEQPKDEKKQQNDKKD